MKQFNCPQLLSLVTAFLVLVTTLKSSPKDLHYTPNELATTATIWSIGPDRFNDNGSIVFDPSNGTMSRGDIIYPINWDFEHSGSVEHELLFMARQRVGDVGLALDKLRQRSNWVPYPSLRHPTPNNFRLTTPIAFITTGHRTTNYSLTTSTIRTKMEIRSVVQAINNYYLHYNTYPPQSKSVTRFLPEQLTTPFSYINQLPVDPYATNNLLRYQHGSTNFITWSVGPDGNSNLSPYYTNQFPPAFVRNINDIIYTNVDGFGSDIYLDPYDSESRIDNWRVY